MEKKKPKKVFVDGPILPEKIANSISSHQSKTDISEHSIFLEQVKSKAIDDNELHAITFSVDETDIEEILYDIRESAFTKFNLSCLHMYHSTGDVSVGEISFFVFTSSPDKNEAAAACTHLVNEFRHKVKISASEVFQA